MEMDAQFSQTVDPSLENINMKLMLDKLESTFLFQCHCHFFHSLDLENHLLDQLISMAKWELIFLHKQKQLFQIGENHQIHQADKE